MQIAGMNHAQRERLAFIDFSLQYFGHVSRQDLVDRFATGLAACTRDFATYKTLAENNLVLQHQSKQYVRTDAFKPLFKHDPEVILTSLSRGFGNGLSTRVQPSEQCMDAVRLIHPKPDIIAALMRASHLQQAVRCDYVSLSSGASQRVLVPHAIVNNGHRWHVRAFDRANGGFRDFVCTRFTAVSVFSNDIKAHEGRGHDDAWHAMVDLIMIPHPSITHPEAIALDYDMHDGKLTVQCRAALAGYLLRQWQVDCSEGYKFTGQGCQLALANREVLGKLENPGLAPGGR
ncbi:WYL domain-containing protein [Fluctibacter halophilus]